MATLILFPTKGKPHVVPHPVRGHRPSVADRQPHRGHRREDIDLAIHALGWTVAIGTAVWTGFLVRWAFLTVAAAL